VSLPLSGMPVTVVESSPRALLFYFRFRFRFLRCEALSSSSATDDVRRLFSSDICSSSIAAQSTYMARIPPRLSEEKDLLVPSILCGGKSGWALVIGSCRARLPSVHVQLSCRSASPSRGGWCRWLRAQPVTSKAGLYLTGNGSCPFRPGELSCEVCPCSRTRLHVTSGCLPMKTIQAYGRRPRGPGNSLGEVLPRSHTQRERE